MMMIIPTEGVIFSDMGSFRNLAAWQRSFALSLKIYDATNRFPAAERYGLTSQLRRAAISVPSNIAEGSRRRGDGQLIYFLNIARGSLGEIECQLEISRDLGFLDPALWRVLDLEAQQISRMLCRLIDSLRLKSSSSATSKCRCRVAPTPDSRLLTTDS